jgi:phage head maturation protease
VSEQTREVKLKDNGDGTVEVSAYASFFEYDWCGGPGAAGWVERIDRDVFERALAQNPAVALTVNFERPLGPRTTDGSLTLSVDDIGLRVRATLPGDDASRLKGTEAAISFRMKSDHWSGDMTHRTITDFSLVGIGLCVVPASPRIPGGEIDPA